MILVIDGWGISCEIALRWLSLAFTDDKSTLVQLIAGHRQATSQYLSQCWPSSLSPYGFTGPQWVNYMVLLFGSSVHIILGQSQSHWGNHSHTGAITITLGQSQDYPSGSEATVKDVGKIKPIYNKTQLKIVLLELPPTFSGLKAPSSFCNQWNYVSFAFVYLYNEICCD